MLFFDGRSLNLGPCIFYALFILTELSSIYILAHRTQIPLHFFKLVDLTNQDYEMRKMREYYDIQSNQVSTNYL